MNVKWGSIIALFLAFVMILGAVCAGIDMLVTKDVGSSDIKTVQMSDNYEVVLKDVGSSDIKTVQMSDNYEVVLLLSRGKGRTKIAFIRDKNTDIIYSYNNYNGANIYVSDLIDLDNVVYGKDRMPMTYEELKETYNLEQAK